MDKSEAYKIVFDDLKKCDLLMGLYDARNGSENFMHGIWTVMEMIAYEVSDDMCNEFDITFARNMTKSELECKK